MIVDIIQIINAAAARFPAHRSSSIAQPTLWLHVPLINSPPSCCISIKQRLITREWPIIKQIPADVLALRRAGELNDRIEEEEALTKKNLVYYYDI